MNTASVHSCSTSSGVNSEDKQSEHKKVVVVIYLVHLDIALAIQLLRTLIVYAEQQRMIFSLFERDVIISTQSHLCHPNRPLAKSAAPTYSHIVRCVIKVHHVNPALLPCLSPTQLSGHTVWL